MADGAHPVGRPERVLPAPLAHLETTGPAVSAPIDNPSEFDPASPAGPVRVRPCAIPIGRRPQRPLPPQILQLSFQVPGKSGRISAGAGFAIRGRLEYVSLGIRGWFD